MYIHIYIYTCIYIRTAFGRPPKYPRGYDGIPESYVCVCMYMNINIYVNTYMRVYMYIHTYSFWQTTQTHKMI